MDESKSDLNLPINYLKIFFRRKTFLLIPLFLGLVGGICAGILMPKEYKSSTIILVEEGKTENPLFSNITVSTSVDQRLNTIRESMLGWNSLVKLVKKLGLDKNVKSTFAFEQLVLGIRNSIIIKMRSTNIIDLSFVGPDPEKTQAIVKTITDIFIERNLEIQNKETADAIVFIEEQLKVYKGKIKSAEIAEMQDRLNALALDSTEKHPLVKQLREQINAKKEELQKENLPYTEGVVLDTQTSNPLIDEIKKALDGLEGTAPTAPQTASVGDKDIYKVMLMDKLDNVLARDVRVNENIYNMLLQRLETAKITQRLQTSKEGTRYTILDPPRLPLKPFKPNKLLLAFLGLVAGAVAGAGLVMLREFFDHSFIDVQEAKEYLGVPLLGAISKIMTPDTIRIEKEKNQWLMSITVVSGIIIVIVSVFISNLK